MAEELIELGGPKKGPKIPYKRAVEIAMRLEKKVRPWVLFADVAGSIRRGKKEIGDIELVVLPKNLHKFLEHLADLGFMGGERIQRRVERGVKLEIYIAHRPDELGAMLLSYTGDWMMNVALRRIAKDRGWLLNQYGLFDQATGEVILKSPYEEDFFGALGVDYHAPEDRSVADRPNRQQKMGYAIAGPARRQVGDTRLELREDPVGGWILGVSGRNWNADVAFGDGDEAQKWFEGIRDERDLDRLFQE